MVRLHSPATGRLQILELKIIKLILTKKLEASLLARSEGWQQHFSTTGSHRSPARALCKGSSPTMPTEHSRSSYSRQGQEKSSNDLTSPNVPVVQLCCLRQHFPICSSPDSPAAVVMLQFHPQILGLNSSPRLLVKVKSHSLGLMAVRSIPPSSTKHWNNIPNENPYQGLKLGLLHSS